MSADTGLDRDGAEVLVLGCAGMADLCCKIAAEIGAPVIDGVTAAVNWVEALVSLGLSTAKRGEFAVTLVNDARSGAPKESESTWDTQTAAFALQRCQ